jgi:deazaflavin-dependent oxidoreductase (nitroreductase family)
MRRALFVRVNRVVNAVVRRLGLRRFRGGDLLLLTTTGRRSGQRRTTPLLHLARDGGWLVVASNGGADWEPGWWLNLRAGAPGTVEVDGRAVPVHGEEVTGPEREQLWGELTERVFDFDSYQAKVSRRIAVVRLTPTSG